MVDESTRLHEKLDFGEAGRALYDFFWGDFADWYIEVTEQVIQLFVHVYCVVEGACEAGYVPEPSR